MGKQGKPATIEVTESNGRRYDKPSGEVLPKPERTTPLDEVLRALNAGDGATLNERQKEIVDMLVELRRYRASITCEQCGCVIIGRKPVCGSCHEAVIEEHDLYAGMAADEAAIGEQGP